jgi:hypothetical protein
MSVPDLFMTRAGLTYMAQKLSFSGGFRIEGLPSSDLIGGDRGFRRPGYIISAEPGITYMAKRTSINLFVPVALVRNRTQSDADKRISVLQLIAGCLIQRLRTKEIFKWVLD